MEDCNDDSLNPFDTLFQGEDDSLFEVGPSSKFAAQKHLNVGLETRPLPNRFIYFLATYSSVHSLHVRDSLDTFDGFSNFLDQFETLAEVEVDCLDDPLQHMKNVVEWLTNVSYETLFHYHYLIQYNITSKIKIEIPNSARCICNSAYDSEDCDISSRLSRSSSSLPRRRISLSKYLHQLSCYTLEGRDGGKESFVLITADLAEEPTSARHYRALAKTTQRFHEQVKRVMSIYVMTKVDVVAFGYMAKDQLME